MWVNSWTWLIGASGGALGTLLNSTAAIAGALWANRNFFFHMVLFSFASTMAWILDVNHLLSLGTTLIGWLFDFLSLFFVEGGTMATTLERMKTIFSDDVISKIIGLAAYFMDLVVPPLVVSTCLGLLMYSWFVALILRAILYIKGHIWSASN